MCGFVCVWHFCLAYTCPCIDFSAGHCEFFVFKIMGCI